MKIFDNEGQKTKIPETAQDILTLLLEEPNIDAINFSHKASLSGLVSLAPYSRLAGRGFGHVTMTKKDFTWLRKAVKTQIKRPIDFHQL